MKLLMICIYPIVMNALLESDLKEFHEDLVRYARKRGGKGRGKDKTDEPNLVLFFRSAQTIRAIKVQEELITLS